MNRVAYATARMRTLSIASHTPLSAPPAPTPAEVDCHDKGRRGLSERADGWKFLQVLHLAFQFEAPPALVAASPCYVGRKPGRRLLCVALGFGAARTVTVERGATSLVDGDWTGR